ncbi:MAG: response regulator [Desulfobulbus sp.]|nr:response regulator [Desulfobulbus sp.]
MGIAHSILIVDDEQPIRRLLTTILKGAGYQCSVAENVAMAKQVLAEKQFDLLLTDIGMPGESGLHLIRHVKDRYPQTAVVMVTIIDDPKKAKEVLQLGIYGYIVKPFSGNLVLITVENALRRHQLELEAQLHTKMLEREVAARTQSLDQQLSFLQTLLDAIPVPVYYKDTHCTYIGCNRAFETIMRRNRQAIVGKTAADIHSPKAAKILQEKDQELLQQGGVQIYEQTLVYSDGTLHTNIIHKATFADSNGTVAGFIGMAFDITELKQTERSLRISEAKLRSIMDNLHIGVAMVSPQMEVLQINRQMQQWFPNAVEEIGTLWCQIFGGQQPSQSCEFFPVKTGHYQRKDQDTTVTLQTVDGERVFQAFSSPVYDGEDNLNAVVQILEDVTEKLNVERELRQAQKLEAIGQLAAGIAHEINTPMQYIGDNINFLNDTFSELIAFFKQTSHLLQLIKNLQPDGEVIAELEQSIRQADLTYLLEEIPQTIRQSLDGVERVGAIVRAMREFSHPGSEEKVPVDINRALDNILIVSRNAWKYVADIETDFAADLPLLHCLPGEINQVFLNIIINAAHAIGDVTDGGNAGKGCIRVSTSVHEQWLEVRIADNGGGIDKTVQDRIFDPFFTTKEIGKGTGQGLAIARNVVVDKHQGTISFATEAGKGTTFIVRLPFN